MSVDSPPVPRKDTRGLPEGFDPHMFYEYRIATLAPAATGIESFVYKYIPWSIIKSFALAIDPLGPFKVAPYTITPFNRTRERGVNSVLMERRFFKTTRSWQRAQQPNWEHVLVCWSPNQFESGDPVMTSFALSPQEVLPDQIDDTTSRTRLHGSEQGTMRFFKSYTYSPTRTVRQNNMSKQFEDWGTVSSQCAAVGGVSKVNRLSGDDATYSIGPVGATFSPHNHEAIRNQEYQYLESLIAQNTVSMLKDWSPHKRTTTLFRNIVELRDIPRSLASLQSTLFNLKSLYTSLSKESLRRIVFDLKRTSKDIPNEYLSFHFGWKQTYKDVMELLESPAKLSKKYSFLIKQAGKPTTFRLKRDFVSGLSEGLPNFSYDDTPIEYDIKTRTRLERTTELRLVINATFDFPPLNIISFGRNNLLDRLGLVPRPTDFYNLIPWTWLVDWFTGLGNYVELIDNMAGDTSLINWGMITGKTTGKLVTNRESKTWNVTNISFDGQPFRQEFREETYRHESIYNYECQIRKDVANAFDVNSIAGLKLSAYQLSILGALLAQRKDKLLSRHAGG